LSDETEQHSEYDFRALQEKWRPIWAEQRLFDVDRAVAEHPERPRKYILDMFPYPSGDLHMGHAEAFCYGDIVARYWRHRGCTVLHPIGWDAFGLPAEDAAIKRGIDPRTWTYDNIAQQKRSFEIYAPSFDWSRELHTSDPEYYRWNQWLFLQMYEKGLAYRKDSWVNWDPVDQTVLANEQVLSDGTSERTGAVVEKKKLTQWYLKITDYADRLLDDLDRLEGHWPSKVLQMQRNWIGRSYGADIDFRVEGRDEPITVFSTRPDTLYGATFMVVAPESDLAAELVSEASPEARMRFQDYLERTQHATEIERQAADRPKTGVFLERYAINPVNGDRLPIWAADYVLADYGHGAVMAVPAHDQRDLDFALGHDLPVRVVVSSDEEDPATSGVAVTGDGVLVDSGPLTGLHKDEAIQAVIRKLEADGTGHGTKTYRLRDWLISRQRYWGTPIPILHAEDGSLVPVPEDQLPVELPPTEGLDLKPRGTSPLGAAEDWVHTTIPGTGEPALRDPDTMDTFVDSSWYYLRYLDPHDDRMPFDPARAREWAPIDVYVGGVEHAILHLLYSRFITKVLHDLGWVDFDEPFTDLINQGMVLLDGSKMSKSKGNLVEFAAELRDHGADALRVTLAFAGPVEDDIDWADVSVQGSAKFLARAWRIAGEVRDAGTAGSLAESDQALRHETHHLLADAPGLVEATKFNVLVARLMQLVNLTRKTIDRPGGRGAQDPAVREAAETLAMMLDVVAPYTAAEMWEMLGHDDPIALTVWPAADPALLVEESVTAVVQVNGKVRARLQVSPDISAEALRETALAEPHVRARIDDAEIRRVIVREPRLVNVVIG
jgi:leucyl-tRNA synthetase